MSNLKTIYTGLCADKWLIFSIFRYTHAAMKNVTGIYKITNKVTGKIYIGSAESIRKRWQVHLCDLKKNKHHSNKLQNAWNKYGEANFELEVVEECSKDNCLEREQYWINYYDAYRNGYNATPIAGNCTGRVVSEKTRKQIAEKLTGRPAAYKVSQQHIDKLTEAKKKRIYQYDVNGAFIKEWPSIKDAEEALQIKRGTISSRFFAGRNYGCGFFWFREYMGEITEVKYKKRSPLSEITKRKISERVKSYKKRAKELTQSMTSDTQLNLFQPC